MAVVLDVNVLVSAVLSGSGTSARLVRAVRDGRLDAVVSPGLLTELRELLRRERFRDYLSMDEVDEYVDEIRRLCQVVSDPDATPGRVRDAKDEYVVALAEAVRAEAIVSGDLDLSAGLAVPVLSPRRAAERFRA